MTNMKKTVFASLLLALLLWGGPIRAQSPYHHTGDIIDYPDSIYFLNDWIIDDWLANQTHQLGVFTYGFANPSRYYGPSQYNHQLDHCLLGELLRCCYTPDTIKVIGLAAVAFTDECNMIHYVNFLDDTLLLYTGQHKNLELRKKVRWCLQDTSNRRWIRPSARGSVIHRGNITELGGCCTTDFRSGFIQLPLLEYYFEDDPVYIADSFFVGCTHSSYYTGIINPIPEGDSMHWYQTAYLLYGYDTISDHCTTCELFPNYKYLIKRTGHLPAYYPLNQWIYEDWRWYLAVWPIIDINYGMPPPPPYACPSVQNIRATYYDECAVLQWDVNSEHNAWQISYGPAGIEPDSGTVINCPIQVGQICLDTGRHYSAFVRSRCNHNDSVYYSDWSDSIDLFVAGSTPDDPGDDTTGVNTLTGRLITLLPNPAHDMVQVVSSFRINRVEVYNLQGILMTEAKANGITLAFSTRDWPAGTYFVIIHTPAGSVSKRLVVKN